MKHTSREITFEDLLLRVRAPEEQPGRILLMLHGWTGDEKSMWFFVRRLPRNFWVLAPRAPHSATPTGYSWRKPSPGGWPSLADLRPSAVLLADFLERFAVANNLPSAQADVIGFSQGGAMAATLAILFPERVGKLGILSGFAPQSVEDFYATRPLEGKPTFVAHGVQDETVSIEYARKSVQVFEKLGAQIEFCKAEVGHKVGAECSRALENFLTA